MRVSPTDDTMHGARPMAGCICSLHRVPPYLSYHGAINIPETRLAINENDTENSEVGSELQARLFARRSKAFGYLMA